MPRRRDKIDKMIAEFLVEMLMGNMKPNFEGIHEFPESSEVVGEVITDEEYPNGMGAIEVAPIIYDESKKDPVVRTNVLESKDDKKKRK
tara:strand:+ start:12116 stop:12382 length:267 start_codon:yes stop_codon:yes gene_type:complete